MGFSKSDGKDITNGKTQNEILEACKDAEIFINNAHSGFSQTEILSSLYKLWKSENKIIINIGVGSFKSELWQLVDNQYTAEKAALHAQVQNLQLENSKCQITLLALGVVDVEETRNIVDQPRIKKDYLLTTLEFILNSSKDFKIEQISIKGILA